MNRLAHERSPYLLQHAQNPVDWYPWGEDAFARARAEDKPIFLSIGYSTCHWCHVMEHESFEDPAVAAVLNDLFIPVKVDREERPDVDRVYMAFVQGTTGSGGWPMSVWLTPELKPFFGGTYFPPTSKWNRPGFVDILRELHRAWTDKRAQIERSSASIIEQLRQAGVSAPAAALPSPDLLTDLALQFRGSFDQRHGGFGDGTKFPRPSELLFLLREHARTGNADAREMVLSTLRAMAVGGVRDHVGGGFHRYAVDAAWRVPHFEKMLYDQAQLVLAYLEGTQVSGDPFHLEVAEDTLRYVMREMTGAEGGFFSAEDADSLPPEHAAAADARKMEGAFYLWRAAELDDLLGDGSPIVKRRFGIEAAGNAPIDPQQEFTGKNLLYVARSIADLAAEFAQTPEQVVDTLSGARLLMFQARLTRPRPHLDDKVITAWNGLMIGAFARASAVLSGAVEDGQRHGAPYLEAARKAASFVHASLWNPDTRTLLRRYRDGRAGIDAYAEDYAYLVFGLLELFKADPRPEWLEWAVVLQQRQDELFWDAESGGWFSTTGLDPTVLVRMKEEYDGAEPSASALSVMNLLTLSQLQNRPEWTATIEQTCRAYGSRLTQMGRAVPMMAAAYAAYTAGVRQVVIVGEGPAFDALVEEAASAYRPFTLTLALSPDAQRALSVVAPSLPGLSATPDVPTAYVCRDGVCRPPVTTPEDLASQLS